MVSIRGGCGLWDANVSAATLSGLPKGDRWRDRRDDVRARHPVITRMTLALVPAPERVWRVLMFYPNLAAMLHDARLLTEDDC